MLLQASCLGTNADLAGSTGMDVLCMLRDLAELWVQYPGCRNQLESAGAWPGSRGSKACMLVIRLQGPGDMRELFRSVSGVSPNTTLKRERLAQRNYIMRATGFLETMPLGAPMGERVQRGVLAGTLLACEAHELQYLLCSTACFEQQGVSEGSVGPCWFRAFKDPESLQGWHFRGHSWPVRCGSRRVLLPCCTCVPVAPDCTFSRFACSLEWPATLLLSQCFCCMLQGRPPTG
jgi:hypothetical protein